MEEKQVIERELSPLEIDVQGSGWQKKDAYYFYHDSNSRTDPKCRALIRKFGIAGYGVFWVIAEMLREESFFELPLNELTFDTIADETRLERGQIDEIYRFCIEVGLLVEDTEREIFWSWALKGRMIPLENKRLGSAKGGRKSKGVAKGKEKKTAELSTNFSTELSPDSQSDSLNSQLLHIEQVTVNEKNPTVPILNLLEENLLNHNPIIVSHAREDEAQESESRASPFMEKIKAQFESVKRKIPSMQSGGGELCESG